MHWTRFAPLLSATSRLDCIWIIDPVPSHWLAETCPAVPNSIICPKSVSGGFDFDVRLDGDTLARRNAVQHLPRLGLGDRTRLLDADGVAGLVFVGLVVRVILLRAADDLPVERVL